MIKLDDNKKKDQGVMVITSGGLDSVTLLYEMFNKYKRVEALNFLYGSKHNDRETQFSEYHAKKLGVPFNRISLDFNSWGFKSDLLQSGGAIPEGHYAADNMKSTVVPFRNAIMLSIATGIAESKGLDYVALGSHKGDHCIPGNELVITNRGKIPMNDICVGDFVLSMDLDNKTLSFKKVLKKVNNGLRNDILNIEAIGGRGCQMTSNHKVFIVDRHSFHQHTGWKKNIREITADKLKIGDFIIYPFAQDLIEKNENLKNKMIDLLPYCDDKNHFTLRYDDKYIWYKGNNKVSRYVDMESFIKLLAWYISEGSMGSGSELRSNSFRIGIAQSKEKNRENYDEIIKIVKKWGFHTTSDKGCTWFSGPTTNVFKLCGLNSYEKQIPNEFFNITPNLWLETLIKGDGYEQESGKKKLRRMTYTTVSYKLKEQICWLGTMLGYTVGVSISNDVLYCVSMQRILGKQSNVLGESKIAKIKKIDKIKSEIVYDIEVEDNHNFFCGKGSSILVSNSQYPDCTSEFTAAMSLATQLGTFKKLKIISPFNDIMKWDVLKLGLDLGVDYSKTWSCYKGGETPCIDELCGTCFERILSFEMNGKQDPLLTDDQWKRALRYTKTHDIHQ